MSDLITFIDFCKYLLKFDAHYKQVGSGATTD